MRVLFLLSMSLVLLISCSTRQGRIVSRTIEAPSLSTNMLGISSRQKIAVYLPPSYERGNRRYPVLYWLPNFHTPLWRYTGGSYQGFHLNQAMDRLIRKGGVREMIVVIPNAMHFLGGSFYQNSPHTGNWEDYLTQDVVGYMDQHFRTIPRAEGRGLTGHGVGGTGALKLALGHPGVFGAVYALSPALFDENGLRDLGVLDKDRLHRYKTVMEQWKTMDLSTQRQNLRFYMQTCLYSPSREQFFDGFNLAYAAAVASDPNLPFPHIAFLPQNGDSSPHANLVDQYEQGFGGWGGRIAQFKHRGRSLRGITIEYAKDDEYQFIRRGTEHLSRLLRSIGLPHELVISEGSHESHLGRRLEAHMIPTMSKLLCDEP